MTTVTAPGVRPVRVERERGFHPLRGLNLSVLRIEVRRALRNKRSMIFSVLMPVFFYIIFGAMQSYGDQTAGRGNVSAWVMVNMALFGAIGASAGGGAAVSIEREHGWTRQLRLTPVTPLGWTLTKGVAAMVGAAVAVGAVFIAGALTKAHATWWVWIACFFTVLLVSTAFSAFGVMVAYLIPSENAAQILGFANTLLAFLGGLFIPIPAGSTMDKISHFTPLWGPRVIASSPLNTDRFDWWAVLNVAAWLAIFVGVAAWRMSKDTKRV